MAWKKLPGNPLPRVMQDRCGVQKRRGGPSCFFRKNPYFPARSFDGISPFFVVFSLIGGLFSSWPVFFKQVIQIMARPFRFLVGLYWKNCLISAKKAVFVKCTMIPLIFL